MHTGRKVGVMLHRMLDLPLVSLLLVVHVLTMSELF